MEPICPSCRDWVAFGLVVGRSRCEWIGVDSKHIDPYWGCIDKDEIFLGVYVARRGDTSYTRKTVDTKEIISDYIKIIQEDKDDMFYTWSQDYELIAEKDANFPEILSEKLTVKYFEEHYPFKTVYNQNVNFKYYDDSDDSSN